VFQDLLRSIAKAFQSRHRRSPSRAWRTFLDDHVKIIVFIDLASVPTILFQFRYVFLVLAHDRMAETTRHWKR